MFFFYLPFSQRSVNQQAQFYQQPQYQPQPQYDSQPHYNQQPVGVRIEIRTKPQPYNDSASEEGKPNAVYVTQPLVFQHPGPRQPSSPQQQARQQGNDNQGARVIPVQIEGSDPRSPTTPRSLNRQQSWGNNPTQSNSIKIIQKITQTDDNDYDDTPLTQHSPRYTQNFQQPTEQIRRMKLQDCEPNRFKQEYKDEFGKPWVMPVVRRAEKEIANDVKWHIEYPSILGFEIFCREATKLLLGSDSRAINEGRCFGIQCLGGTGALSIGAELLSQILDRRIFYCSKPTWNNHYTIFSNAGFEEGREYHYTSTSENIVNFEMMSEDLRNATDDSVIIFQVCAHNPTGCDLSREEWKQAAVIVKEKRLFPFFDCAYQGLVSGDVAEDAWPVRYFVQQGFELFCAQSFSKNFGLYNERVGNLVVVLRDPETLEKIKSHFTSFIRGMYNSPPNWGARIVTHILTQEELFNQWIICLKSMADRIKKTRRTLRENLESLGTPGDWNHITRQTGLYTHTGLNVIQCEYMLKIYRIYMCRSGRFNMGGINEGNVEYIAKAIFETLRVLPAKIEL